MFAIGDMIIYNESGVCVVQDIAPLSMQGADKNKLYYYLAPYVGSGTYFAPVEGNAFMRPIISGDEALAFIDTIPEIIPAVCNDNRFNHVDAYYKELFRRHTNEALVSIIKGLFQRMAGRKTRSTRGEATMKHAKDILYSEFAAALDIEFEDVEGFIIKRLGCKTEET